MKKVIFTSNLDKYDKIKPIIKQQGWNYINFIDWEISEKEKNNSNWTFVMIPDYVKNMNISSFKKQRYIKLHPHLFFKDYDLSLYIDSTYTIFGDINNLILRILSPDYNIVMPEHPDRNKVYDELNEVALRRREKKSKVKIVRERYNKENFEDNYGLVEGNFILRRHNEKDCIDIMEKWWNEILMYSHRDQLSFNYVLWKEHKKAKFISKKLILHFFHQSLHEKKVRWI